MLLKSNYSFIMISLTMHLSCFFYSDFLEVQKQGDRKIWYLVNIHRGHFVKKDDYNVQVTYCGITVSAEQNPICYNLEYSLLYHT